MGMRMVMVRRDIMIMSLFLQEIPFKVHCNFSKLLIKQTDIKWKSMPVKAFSFRLDFGNTCRHVMSLKKIVVENNDD